MKDLPRAGAAWLLTSKSGPEVEEAVRAFHARYGKDAVNALRAVRPHAPSECYPPPVRERLIAWGYRYRPYRARSNPHGAEDARPPAGGLRPFELGCLFFSLLAVSAVVLYILRYVRDA